MTKFQRQEGKGNCVVAKGRELNAKVGCRLEICEFGDNLSEKEAGR